MILTLTNAYPAPRHPEDFTVEEYEAFAEIAGDFALELPAVVVQQLHTFTVQFADEAACEAARHLTGWGYWHDLTLEAPAYGGGGYGPYPGILVNKPYVFEGREVCPRTEYCGFILQEDRQ